MKNETNETDGTDGTPQEAIVTTAKIKIKPNSILIKSLNMQNHTIQKKKPNDR